MKLGDRAKMDVPMYEGNLDAKELLDWIRSMDKYFDYENVDEGRKVRHAVTRLIGHAALWWDELQAERRRKGKQKIKILMYEANLYVEELLDWIRSMGKYFDYEDVDEEKKVRHVFTILKGNVALWWDELQAERRSRGKQ